MKKKSMVKKLVGRFHLDFQVKALISSYYYADAEDWISLYEVSSSIDQGKLSVRTKRFVFLYYTLECLLKALLICLSKKKENSDAIYRVAKGCSHRLTDLVQECGNRANGRHRIFNKVMKERIELIAQLGINIRYDLDMKNRYLQEFVISNPPSGATNSGTGCAIAPNMISEAILNDAFHDLVMKDVLFLKKSYERFSQVRFKNHRSRIASNNRKVMDQIGLILDTSKSKKVQVNPIK